MRGAERSRYGKAAAMSASESRVVALRSDGQIAANDRHSRSQHEPDVQERVYQLWAWKAAKNCAAAVRHYEREVEPGTPIPAERTVRHWVQTLGWNDRLNAELVRDHGEILYEMQLRDLLRHRYAGEKLDEVLANADPNDPMSAVIVVKIRELTGREIERKIKAVLPQVDKSVTRAWNELTIEEREAAMRDAVQKDKQ